MVASRFVASPGQGEVTGWLLAWSGGDRAALDRLVPVVYQELRRLAARQMRRERAGHSLQTTALVNEAYLRLVDYKNVRPRDRSRLARITLDEKNPFAVSQKVTISGCAFGYCWAR